MGGVILVEPFEKFKKTRYLSYFLVSLKSCWAGHFNFFSFFEDSGSLLQFPGSVEKHLNVKSKKALKKADFIVLF